MMTQYEKMTGTKIEKLVSILAIPTVISMLVTAIYNMADTYFVSHINDSASAAISVVFSLMTLIQSIGFTIGMGSGSLISRCLGKKDDNKASTIASNGILFGLILGALFLTFGLIFNPSIMFLLGASETSQPYATEYAKWIFIASPIMISSFIMNNILRSEGKATISMIGLGIGGVLNIALDPLFIYGFNMGISGAGLATMISQVFSFCTLSFFFLIGKTISKINVTHLSFDYRIYLEVLKVGSPTLFRQGFATVANIIVNFLAKPYGDAVVAAIGITAKVYLFVRNIVIGIGQGYQPVLGFNYGASKYARIRKAFLFTLLLQTIVCLIATIIVLVFPYQLISAFKDKGNTEGIEIGAMAIRFLAISFPFLGFSTIVNQSLQVIGYSKSAGFLASCRQGIVYTPVIFSMWGLFQSTGLCLAQPLSDFLTAVISIPFCIYFFKILKKKELEEEKDIA